MKMLMLRKCTITLIALIWSLPALNAQNKTWTIDPDHSRIQFKSVFMSITDVYGIFKDYTGTVVTGGNEFDGASIEVTIQVESIDTENDKRDGHLRSEDFFYAENYPEIHFKSLSFSKEKDSTFLLQGELTMRGVTRNETFHVVYNGMVDLEDQQRAAFKLSGTVNRFDYNINWNKSFARGLIVSKEIAINCEISLVSEKKQPDPGEGLDQRDLHQRSLPHPLR